MNNRPPLPRLFHLYMGILVILGAFAMGQSARSCLYDFPKGYADFGNEPHVECGCICVK